MAAEPRTARWRVVRFVTLFTLLALLLLTSYHYLSQTHAMDRYLFQVAKHTSFVLDIVGERSTLENASLWRGREAELRARIAALENGGEVLDSSPASPVSAWELWRYRILNERHERKLMSDALVLMPPLGHVAVDSHRQLLAFLDVWLARMDATVELLGPQAVAIQPDLMPRLETVRRLINTYKTQVEEDTVDGQVLLDFAKTVETLYNELRTGIEKRHLEKTASRNDFGPFVYFVYEAGTITQLQDVNARIQELQNKGDAAHKTEVVALRAESAELVAELQRQTETGADSRDMRGIAFAFNVVPDCGALESMIIFFCAVVAFPAALTKKTIGVAMGLPLLYLINIARLSCLAVIGAFSEGGDVFEFAHHYVWQGIFVIFVVAIWLIWIELIVTPRQQRHE